MVHEIAELAWLAWHTSCSRVQQHLTDQLVFRFEKFWFNPRNVCIYLRLNVFHWERIFGRFSSYHRYSSVIKTSWLQSVPLSHIEYVLGLFFYSSYIFSRHIKRTLINLLFARIVLIFCSYTSKLIMISFHITSS